MPGDIRNNRAVRFAMSVLSALLLICAVPAEGRAESTVKLDFSWQAVRGQSQQTIYIYAEMVNGTDRPADPSLVQVSVTDSHEEIAGETGQAKSVSVPPGRTYCFMLTWTGGSCADPVIRLSYPENAEYEGSGSAFVESEGYIRETGGQFDGAVAELRNPTDRTLSGIGAAIALYDSDGKLIYVRELDTGSVPLSPGASAWISWDPYEKAGKEACPLPDAGKVGRARVFSRYPAQGSSSLRFGDFTYEPLEDGTVSVTRYSGDDRELTVPAVMDCRRVSAVRSGTFTDCDDIVSLSFSEGTEVLESDAVNRCGSLELVTLPASMKSIEDSQFTGCPMLKEIKVDPGNTEYTMLDNVLFSVRDGMLLCYPQGRLDTAYTVPGWTKVLGMGCFEGNESLRRVTLPEGLTTIRDGAFYLCGHLSELSIPASVTEIGRFAFQGTALRSAEIPEGVTSLEYCTFMDCKSLEEVVLPDSLTTIGESALRSTAIKGITLPESLTVIDHLAFMDCDSLKRITVPQGVKDMGTGVFVGCGALEEIEIRGEDSAFRMINGMLCDLKDKRVISGVFPGGSSRTEVPQGIRTIDPLAFVENKALTEVILPDTLTGIGDYAFSNCTSLGSVIIPESVTDIGVQAFEYCISLREIVLPDGITRLSMGTFNECSSLSAAVLPGSLKEIGMLAFRNCGSLENIIIPDTVTSIGYGAFAGCGRLQEINLPPSVTSVGEKAFYMSPTVTVSAEPGSYAWSYCRENGIGLAGPD